MRKASFCWIKSVCLVFKSLCFTLFLFVATPSFSGKVNKTTPTCLVDDQKKTVIRTTPKVAKEELLDKIIEQYKGKVVVVDFWATWCPPCLYGMTLAEPVKEKFKSKDVVFVYITNPTSPLDEWNTKIQSLEGDHYYLDREKWDYIMNEIESKGIPSYLIYDKNGDEVHKSIGFMGAEKLEEWINESL